MNNMGTLGVELALQTGRLGSCGRQRAHGDDN